MGIISTDLKPYYSEDRTDRIRTIGGPPVYLDAKNEANFFPSSQTKSHLAKNKRKVENSSALGASNEVV